MLKFVSTKILDTSAMLTYGDPISKPAKFNERKFCFILFL